MKMYLKMRGKQPVGLLNPWNFDLEPGDKVVDGSGIVYRLVQSTGKDKRAAGELTPRKITPPISGAIAVKKDGIWLWLVSSTNLD